MTLNVDKHDAAMQLLDPDCPGAVLLALAGVVMGDRLFDGPPVDPLEVYAELNDAFGVWVTDEGKNRLQALLLVTENPEAFYQDPYIFACVAQALWDGDLGELVEGVFDPPGFFEMSWAAVEVNFVTGLEEDFSAPITEMMTSSLRDFVPDGEAGEVESDDVTERMQDLLMRLATLGLISSGQETPEETRGEVASPQG